MKKIKLIVFFLILNIFNGCSVYNFTGSGKISAKTFQVNFFRNNAPIIEPGIDIKFTRRLQDLLQNQTNMNLTPAGGDLVYEGEIVDYYVSPMAANANQRASQNRITIAVNLKFTNKKKEADSFEKRFSHFYDFPANEQLTGKVLTAALEEIYERITQDIFNETLAKW
jgi:hypothetical protein